MKKLYYITVVAIIAIASSLLSSCTEEELKVKSDGQGATELSQKQWG